jgi:hypothetical protein
MSTKAHEEKNAAGQSVHAGKQHVKKNATGKSVHAVKMGTKAHEEKDTAGKSVHNIRLHEEMDADSKSVHAAKMRANRKYSAVTDGETANFECPNCSKLYFHATPRENSGHKRKHQKCGGKSQVLVQYHAVH